jgi:hypothetical protein
MLAMFWGEMAALAISATCAVLVWLVTPTDSVPLLLPVSIAAFLVSAKAVLAFVHLGYERKEEASE